MEIHFLKFSPKLKYSSILKRKGHSKESKTLKLVNMHENSRRNSPLELVFTLATATIAYCHAYCVISVFTAGLVEGLSKHISHQRSVTYIYS